MSALDHIRHLAEKLAAHGLTPRYVFHNVTAFQLPRAIDGMLVIDDDRVPVGQVFITQDPPDGRARAVAAVAAVMARLLPPNEEV